MLEKYDGGFISKDFTEVKDFANTLQKALQCDVNDLHSNIRDFDSSVIVDEFIEKFINEQSNESSCFF